jgi:transcriptional regulator with XRE-family HTH domain
MKIKPVRSEEIGDLMKAARLAASMTQTDLGEAIGLTFQMVQKYEKGRSDITARRLVQVAAALGVRAVDLLPERAR